MLKGLFAALFIFLSFSATAGTRLITLVNYERDGVKQWLPDTVSVRKGDDVQITLINNVPSGLHSFTIEGLDITQDVTRGKKEILTFKADKEGVFKMMCHKHGHHIAGNFIVLH